MNGRVVCHIALCLALAPAALAADSETRLRLVPSPLTGKLVTDGRVFVYGWADDAAGDPLVRMEIDLDGIRRGDVLIRQYRPDVAETLRRPDRLWSGWIASVSLRGIRAGPHAISVLGYSRNGEIARHRQEFIVREFASPFSEPVWRIYLILLLQSLAFFLWLMLLGWGPLRWFTRKRLALLAPVAGLALLALSIEAGAALRLRPLVSGLFLTAVSVATLVVSFRRRRPRYSSRDSRTPLFAAALFAASVAIPLAAHGSGAVLGTIADAAWESSVGDSIARFGWDLPAEYQGHLILVPREWRRVHFRGGVPYLLAVLSQAFAARSHAVHSAVVICAGALAICSVGALSRRILGGLRGATGIALALASSSSLLFASAYDQHAGILIATVLLLGFLYHLIETVRRPHAGAAIPLAWTAAAAWTLYPEMMPLWIGSAAVSLLLSQSRQRTWRTAKRLVVALVIAAALNPIGLVRTLRFEKNLASAHVLSTPALRIVFGDIHYFPPLAVLAGVEPFQLDAPVSPSWRIRAATAFAGMLLLLGVACAIPHWSPGDGKLLLLLLGPVACGLAANRLLAFPYGYSKVMVHAAPLSAIAVGLLLARCLRRGPAAKLRRSIAISAAVVTVALSIWSAREVVSRALRAVPAYDPAFQSIEDSARGAGPKDDVLTSASDPAEREWIAYFLGIHQLYYASEDSAFAPVQPGRGLWRLIDRRDSGVTIFPTGTRANRFFACVPKVRSNPLPGSLPATRGPGPRVGASNRSAGWTSQNDEVLEIANPRFAKLDDIQKPRPFADGVPPRLKNASVISIRSDSVQGAILDRVHDSPLDGAATE